MRFIKKPVVVDAIRFVYTDAGIDELRSFCGPALIAFGRDRHAGPGAKAWAQIGTLEDGKEGQAKHIATEGDWIIKGVRGEVYPCKPDIFVATYEEAPPACLFDHGH